MALNEEMKFITHICGCDGVGKSTLTKALSEKINLNIKHFGVPKDYNDGKKQYFDFINELDQSIICDRYHDGEWIYAPIYRGYSGDYMKELENKIVESSNYLLVYVKTDLETIIQRTRKRGEDFVKEEHFQIVLNKYEKYLEQQSMPFLIVDTTDSKTEDDVNEILKHGDNVNNIWNAIRGILANFGDDKVILPWGNVKPTNMIVFDAPTNNNGTFVKDLIYSSWFTSLIPYQFEGDYLDREVSAFQHLIKLQYKRLKPEKVYATNEKTALILESFLNTDVHIL